LGFDRDCAVFGRNRQPLDFVEQNRLSHSPQASQKHALFWFLLPGATKKNPRLLQDWIASDEFGRWRTGTWRKRILDWVHVSIIASYTRLYLNSDTNRYKLVYAPV
jgi:hypothetical protein